MNSSNIEGLHLLGSARRQIELEGELADFELGCEDITVSNVISRLMTKLRYDQPITEEISFASSHMSKVSGSAPWKSIDVSTLELILSDSSMKNSERGLAC